MAETQESSQEDSSEVLGSPVSVEEEDSSSNLANCLSIGTRGYVCHTAHQLCDVDWNQDWKYCRQYLFSTQWLLNHTFKKIGKL